MFSGVEAPRYQVENLGMSTQIAIPARKNWITLIFMGVWLTGWLFGELFALGVLFSSVGGLLVGIFDLRGFDFIDFDLTSEEEQDKIRDEMGKYGSVAFPFVKIGEEVVIGYNPDKYSKLFGFVESG